MSDYQWPADPRIPRLLALLDGLQSEVSGRVHRAASVEVRDELLRVVWSIDAAKERARHIAEHPTRPDPPAEAPSVEPSPLDQRWPWQQHEADR